MKERVARRILDLRRKRLTAVALSETTGIPRSTIGRLLRRERLSRYRDLLPKEPVLRYEHPRPGDLLHMDTKKLGRIKGIGHRITGDRRSRNRGIGWEFVHVAIDDHSRLAYVEVLADELAVTTAGFLKRAVAYFEGHGITIRRTLTDNGGNYRSKILKAYCEEREIRQRFTRPYRPRTNGKAERFIQTLLRQWAYRRPYSSSKKRSALLPRWLHFYNHHRKHSSLGGRPPFSRVNNLVSTNT
jgi:transposase InsO family protein